MPDSAASVCYRFGRFELQPDERRLLAAGSAVRVGPHALDLLIALVERSGRSVTEAELLEGVWPKVIGEENPLQALISALRKILGSAAIATISRRGYRFTPEVTPVGATATTPPPNPRHNLPHQVTSFIGREKEIAELERLLSTTRLLTLTGAGGCGKTRLAVHLAANVVQGYPDGCWLVEFAALADPGLVPQKVANVLGIKEQSSDPHGIVASLTSLGHSAVEQGDYPAARVLLEEGLAISRELGYWYLSDALYHLGTAAYFQCDYPGARARLEESLTIRRALGHRQGIAGPLPPLGYIHPNHIDL